MTPRPNPGPRILIFGDSICKYRVAETEEDWPRSKTWPRLLKAAFVAAGYQPTVMDLGTAGWTSGHFCSDNYLYHGAQISTYILPLFVPDIVILELGTNDCQAYDAGVRGTHTNANLDTLIARSVAVGCSRIIAANIIHKFADAAYLTHVSEFNTAINDAATDGGAYTCDFYTAYDADKGSAVDDDDQATYAADGIHPGELGHSLLHTLVWAIVQANGWDTAHYGRRA